MNEIRKIEAMLKIPEPDVVGGHYRDHSDTVNGFSYNQMRSYAREYAAQALAVTRERK